MSRHTDIVTGGWVALLPESARPYALLARLDRPIGAWLLFLPGLWSLALTARGVRLPLLLTEFALGSVLMRSAGCVVNDMWDRELDRQVTRTANRPLAAGRVSLRAAMLFLLALLLASLLILLRLNRLAQLLGVASLVLVALYPAAKRVTWWPQAVLGLTFAWGAPMGFAAGAGHLAWPAAGLYAAAIAWILGYDTIYAHQDREDDALVGIRSTALLSAARPRWFVGACYGLMVVALLVTGQLAGLSGAFYVLMVPAAGLLGWQVARLDVHDPAGCLALFRANREVGLLVGLALLAGRL